jgi:hypothetical protein
MPSIKAETASATRYNFSAIQWFLMSRLMVDGEQLSNS